MQIAKRHQQKPQNQTKTLILLLFIFGANFAA